MTKQKLVCTSQGLITADNLDHHHSPGQSLKCVPSFPSLPKSFKTDLVQQKKKSHSRGIIVIQKIV